MEVFKKILSRYPLDKTSIFSKYFLPLWSHFGNVIFKGIIFEVILKQLFLKSLGNKNHKKRNEEPRTQGRLLAPLIGREQR